MTANKSGPKYGLCMINRAGWKSIRVRMEKWLPELIPEDWTHVHLEDHGKMLGVVTKKIGKFKMVHDIMSGRWAAQAAIRKGARKIIFGTYHNIPWLPQKRGVRYFIFSDATMRQLSNLGYTGENRDISRLAKLIYGRGVRRQAEAGHHFFCMSHWYADALMLEHSVKPEQITIIPPIVDTVYWTPSVSERSPGPLRVVFIGADFTRKGGDVLMAVINLPEFSEVEWHLVTKSSPTTTRQNVFCYTQFDTDAEGMRTLVQSSDVHVLPTTADCSPIAILEASACGIPSIATRMAGIVDLIDDGVSGYLLTKPDVENLSAALRNYIVNPALLVAHGRAAREKIITSFDTKVVIKKIHETMARVD